MTREERLRAAAAEVRLKHGRILLASGGYLDEIMTEAADEMRSVYESFGRALLDESLKGLLVTYGEEMVEEARRIAQGYSRPTIEVGVNYFDPEAIQKTLDAMGAALTATAPKPEEAKG